MRIHNWIPNPFVSWYCADQRRDSTTPPGTAGTEIAPIDPKELRWVLVFSTTGESIHYYCWLWAHLPFFWVSLLTCLKQNKQLKSYFIYKIYTPCPSYHSRLSLCSLIVLSPLDSFGVSVSTVSACPPTYLPYRIAHILLSITLTIALNKKLLI